MTDDTSTIHIRLDYPLQHVKDPIIYHLVTDFDLVPNIQQAKIDVHSGGVLVLKLEGTRHHLEAGMEYLRAQGIAVTELPE